MSAADYTLVAVFVAGIVLSLKLRNVEGIRNMRELLRRFDE